MYCKTSTKKDLPTATGEKPAVITLNNPILLHEKKLWSDGFRFIAGVDEAGRGPLAGPLVVAAAILPYGKKTFPPVNDSKKLSPKERERIYAELMSLGGFSFAVVRVEVDEIDRINIFQAVIKGMRQAVEKLPQAQIALVDGISFKGIPLEARFIIKGDAKSASIAAASIVAKVERDRIMREYALEYPQYGFDKNMGYGTQKHLEALAKHGPCEIHRKSYAPVRDMISPQPVQQELDLLGGSPSAQANL